MKIKTRKPVIGITMSLDKKGLVRQGVDYSFIRREYGAQLQAAGASPVFLDNTIHPEAAAQLCDGIIISGGEDIAPGFYGESETHVKGTEPTERTAWERLLIDKCDKKGVKILGICYGSQLLNVHYGGTLYQDIAKETGSKLDHGSSAAAALHDVVFKTNFLGYKKGDVVASASRHHQAVKDVAPGFKVVAHAHDEVIEAIRGYGHYGIQWHAESDATAGKIYGSFVNNVQRDSFNKVTITRLPQLLGSVLPNKQYES